MAKTIKVKNASLAEHGIIIPEQSERAATEQHLPWKRNPDGDPEYIWRSYRNADGEMVYSVPFEAPNDIPLDETEGAMKFSYMNHRLFGSKRFRVYWLEITDREVAFEQKRWLDAEAKRIERRNKREFPAAEVRSEDNNGNSKKEWKLLDDPVDYWDATDDTPDSTIPGELTEDAQERDTSGEQTDDVPEGANADELSGNEPETNDWDDDEEEDEKAAPAKKSKFRRLDERYEPYRYPETEPYAITRVELARISKYLEEKQPRWWRALYLREWENFDTKEIAEELNVHPSRVPQLIESLQKLARKYRKENN